MKKFFVFLLCFLLPISIFSLEWKYEDGALIISGEGEIPDFEDYASTPWAAYRDGILKLYVEEGITSIGKNSFQNSSSLVFVYLPKSLKRINDFAFYNCSTLISVEFEEGLEYIGNEAFNNCELLYKMEIPGTVKHIGEKAFQKSSYVKTVKIPDDIEFVGKEAFNSKVEVIQNFVNKSGSF